MKLMTMRMVLAILAAFAFTIGGVAMKYADGVPSRAFAVVYVALFGVGAVLQAQAMRGAGLGTTYILVLGLEAVLAFALGVALFGESATVRKLAAVTLIVVGIALLRAD